MPSWTFSYNCFPSGSMGNNFFKSGSCCKLELIQSEKASCSSSLTEWVVPSFEAWDVPPKCWRFSLFDTAVLKVFATSFALRSQISLMNSSYVNFPFIFVLLEFLNSSSINRDWYPAIFKPHSSNASLSSFKSICPSPFLSIWNQKDVKTH